MNKNSKLQRYKNPEKQLEYINDWTKDNYKSYTFRLHKEKDKDLIKYIDNRKTSLRKLLTELFNKK